MTSEQYEHTKQKIEEQLRAGIALLESACNAQLRALDLVWMLHAEGSGVGPVWLVDPASSTAPAASPPASQGPPPSAPEPPRRRSAHEIESDVGSLFWRLPETFTRSEVCEVLGYEPDRGILYRVLQKLAREGYLLIESKGEGKRATVYRKIGGPGEPQDG